MMIERDDSKISSQDEISLHLAASQDSSHAL